MPIPRDLPPLAKIYTVFTGFRKKAKKRDAL